MITKERFKYFLKRYFSIFCFVLFGCATACGILVPWSRTKPLLPALEVQSLGQPGKSKSYLSSGHLRVAQWRRFCLPTQGAQIWSLAWEDSTAMEQLSPCITTTEACAARACALWKEKPLQRSLCTAMRSSSHSPQPEKTHAEQQRPRAAKNKKTNKII